MKCPLTSVGARTIDRQKRGETGDSCGGHHHMGGHESDRAAPGRVEASRDSDSDVGNETETHHDRHQCPEKRCRLMGLGPDQLPADCAAKDA